MNFVMNSIAWNRLQWLPPLWGTVGAIAFLLIPLSYELSFLVAVGFVLVGGGLLLFIAKMPLTYDLASSARLDSGRAFRPACIE